MSDNVIKGRFPVHLVSRESSAEQDGARANENRIRARELVRLREIQRASERKSDPLKFSIEDRQKAAEVLWELTKEYTTRGQQNAIKEAFGDTHIHRLMAKPSAETKDSRVPAKEMKGQKTVVRPFLRLAKAIAAVAGKDANDFQLRILRSTNCWKNFGRSPVLNDAATVADEATDKVTHLLQSICGRIVRDTDLTALFARMRRVSGQWDIRKETFRPSGMSCLFGTAYENWHEHWRETPPFPTIPLVRLRHAGPSFQALLSKDGSHEPLDETVTQKAVEGESSEEKSVELHIFREIRLALGPTVNAVTLGPMFESRVYAELRVFDDVGKELNRGPLDFDSMWNLHSLSSETSAAVFLDNNWQRFTPRAILDDQSPEEQVAKMSASLLGRSVESPFYWDFTPLAENKNCFENYYISYTPVDAAHVAHWLDKPSDGGQPVESLPGGSKLNAPTETWFPWGSLGRLVELAIAEGRLEAALRSEIAHIRKTFETHEAEWRERMQERTAEQIAEYNSDLRTAHSTDDESANP